MTQARCHRRRGAAALAPSCAPLLFLLVAGCASPPADRFYTVSAGAQAAGPREAAASRIIAVATVRLPPLIDRPQLVLRTGAHEIVLLEHDRWAQPLAEDLTRALVAGLQRAAPGIGFTPADAPPSGPAAEVLEVQIVELLSGPGPVAALSASWTLRDRAGTTTRQGQVEKSVPAPGGREAIALAYAEAMTSLAQAIGEAIR